MLPAAVLLVFLLWLFVQPETPTEKKDFVQAVGVLLAALAGLGGLYFTWQGLTLTRENTQQQLEQARESQELTQRLTERGQITDRFTRAIDQLGATDAEGNKLFEIRLGGIYALERIARESEEDHWPIMEVLTAYVRQNAPKRPEEQQEVEEGAAAELPMLDPDIQAIMTVLRLRHRYFEHGEPEPLDLHETDLAGANLSGANLRGAFLSRANLSYMYLGETDLRGANLGGVDLSGAHLSGKYRAGSWSWSIDEPWAANLSGAHLVKANLSHAELPGVDLSGANLYGANLSGAILPAANLQIGPYGLLSSSAHAEGNLTNVELSKVELSKVELSKANLEGAILWEAKLSEARLWEANLSGADLSEAELSGANLEGANLEGADLSGAILSGWSDPGVDHPVANIPGTNLSEAKHLTQEQLEQTIGDEKTQLPSDLKPPTHWGVKTDEQPEED